MPSKLQTYMQMADDAQRQITGSYRGWTGFLTTAARLYKYPYAEQVMIHAQRPDATACAEYDFWNEKMGRYVRRGSKGIALIDSSGERPRLRYVFDVSDTGGREFPKSRYLWEYREEHADAVSAMLESRYGVDGKGGLPDQLERIASQLAEEYWRDYKRDILAIVDDSFLYGYDEFNVGAAFQSAAAVSINNIISAIPFFMRFTPQYEIEFQIRFHIIIDRRPFVNAPGPFLPKIIQPFPLDISGKGRYAKFDVLKRTLYFGGIPCVPKSRFPETP